MGKQKHLRINEAMVLVAIVRPCRLRGNEKVLTSHSIRSNFDSIAEKVLAGTFAERVLTWESLFLTKKRDGGLFL
jgi:hypothetical protein